jgi:hypothetical protein
LVFKVDESNYGVARSKMILYKKIKSEFEEQDYFGFENDDLQKKLKLNRVV